MVISSKIEYPVFVWLYEHFFALCNAVKISSGLFNIFFHKFTVTICTATCGVSDIFQMFANYKKSSIPGI